MGTSLILILIDKYSGFNQIISYNFRHECGFTDMLYKSDVGVWILAHRSVATYPKEIFLENFHKGG